MPVALSQIENGLKLQKTVEEISAKMLTKFVKNIGNGIDKIIPVVHNLGTRDVMINIYQNSEPYPVVYADIAITDENVVTIKFNQPPKVDQYRVVIIG